MSRLADGVVVGRDDSCDTVLDGREISRRHAEICGDGSRFFIKDLGSRNGLYVDGVQCDSAPLKTGSVVRCGEWIAIITAESDPMGFREIAPGWFGGTKLLDVVRPTGRVSDELPIIIQGESGTGKEGLARAIHTWSRRTGPFVAVNCAALPLHLAESELFGHRKGAFTGADSSNPGLFRSAHMGTLFLDEIQELPPPIQAKMLRVLEQREVLPVGDTTTIPIDVRVICATQESLATAVAEGRFRGDIHARLDGLTVTLPPLRQRREDIAPLFLGFLRQYANDHPPAVDAKTIEALCLYNWPFNVRELVLLAKRLLGMYGTEPVLIRAHLPERILTNAPTVANPGNDSSRLERTHRQRSVTDDTEFRKFVSALQAHNGNVARASVAIGITRAKAYRLLSARPDFSLEQFREHK